MSRAADPIAPSSPAGLALISRLPLQVAAFCLLWASAYSVAKIAMLDCPPLILLTARFLLAGLAMAGLAALTGVPLKLGRRDLLVFAVLGIANQAAYLGIGYIGLRSISSGLSALIVSANPVLTAVLATVFLKDRMTGRKIAGLLLGVGGVAVVVGGRLTSGTDDPVGIGLTVVALISLVGGTILYKRLAPVGGHWMGNTVQNIAAGLATLPLALTFERAGDVVPSWRLAMAIAYLALIVGVFAYIIWFELLDAVGATAASSYHFLMPPLGLLFGWLLLGERVAPADLVGIVPVALGIYLVTRAPRHGKPS